MFYTVTIVDDRNNQKLRGQSWDEVADLFGCQAHGLNVSLECATCTLRDEILDALAEVGHYYSAGTEYSAYYGADTNWTISVSKED